MFTVNYVVPKGVSMPIVTTGYSPHPLQPVGSEWAGIGCAITLCADCVAYPVNVTSLDRFQESSGYYNENNVLNSKIKGEVSYTTFTKSATLISECQPVFQYQMEALGGSKVEIGRIVAYPLPVMITANVSGPQPPEHAVYKNTYSETINMSGAWYNQTDFHLVYSVRHEVWDTDGAKIQDVTRYTNEYYRWNAKARRWTRNTKGWDFPFYLVATEFLGVNPYQSYPKYAHFSLPQVYVSTDKSVLLTNERKGDLALRACQSLKTNDVNMISYCKEIPGLPALAISTIKSLTNLDNPKSWADLFLSTKYGWNMTIKDTADIAEYAKTCLLQKDNQQTVVRSSVSFNEVRWGHRWPVEAHMKIKIGSSNTSPMSQLRKLINSGFWPTATNLWDMVPYSFVVNWLTGIQSVITAIDANIYADTLPVQCCVCSVKTSHPVDARFLGAGYLGNLDSTFYSRRVSRSIPYVPLQLGDFSLQKHIVEATALIAQHKFK